MPQHLKAPAVPDPGSRNPQAGQSGRRPAIRHAALLRSRSRLPMLVFLGLAGCAVPAESNIDPETGFFKQVPEAVAAIAAPGQDLSAVRLRTEDGCYWYRYSGPVETTMLPLRAAGGRQICTRPAEEPPAQG